MKLRWDKILNLNKIEDYIIVILLTFENKKNSINSWDSDYLIENIIINQFFKFFNEINVNNINNMNLRSIINSEISGISKNIRDLNKKLGIEYVSEDFLDEHYKKINQRISNRDILKQLMNEWIEINAFLTNLKSDKLNNKELVFGNKNEQIINYANNVYSINERFLKKINQVINKKEKKYTIFYLKKLISININNVNLNYLNKYINENKNIFDEWIKFDDTNKPNFRNDPEHNEFITNYSYKECLFYLFIQLLLSLFIAKIINLIPNNLWPYE